MAILITSANPLLNSLSDKDDKFAMSIMICWGCLTVPTRFLADPKFMPVLPPTVASTIANKVVGM